MPWTFFGLGLVVGFAIAAPVGAIGVLCIRRTLAGGRAAGLATGMGAATVDAAYGAVAAFGLTAISGFLVSRQTWLRLAGGLFLCYLGVRTFVSRPPSAAVEDSVLGVAGAYASTFFLTLTNPSTIISFAAVFASLGLAARPGSDVSAAALVGGVFSGSAAWWLLLSSVVSLLRARFDETGMRWVNRVSGVVVAGFGVAALVSLAI